MQPSATRPHGRLTGDEYRAVIGHFASGVTVVTTRRDGIPYGTTASAVTSLSLDPPMLVLCLNQTSSTGAAIAATGRFGVSILSEDQEGAAVRFAAKGSTKFDGVTFYAGALGQPLLEGARNGKVTPEMLEQVEAAEETADLAYLRERIPQACERTVDGVHRVSKIVSAMRPAFGCPRASDFARL